MKLVTIIGTLAAIITTAGFIPQVLKGFETKKMDDVAIWQPLMLVIGMSFWLAYGIMLMELPIIAANSVAITFNLIIIAQKVIYGKAKSL